MKKKWQSGESTGAANTVAESLAFGAISANPAARRKIIIKPNKHTKRGVS